MYIDWDRWDVYVDLDRRDVYVDWDWQDANVGWDVVGVVGLLSSLLFFFLHAQMQQQQIKTTNVTPVGISTLIRMVDNEFD